MRLHMEHDIQISRGPAPHAPLTIAGGTEARSGVYARGDTQSNPGTLFLAARSAADLAGILDNLPGAATTITGLRHTENTA